MKNIHSLTRLGLMLLFHHSLLNLLLTFQREGWCHSVFEFKSSIWYLLISTLSATCLQRQSFSFTIWIYSIIFFLLVLENKGLLLFTPKVHCVLPSSLNFVHSLSILRAELSSKLIDRIRLYTPHNIPDGSRHSL